MKSVMCRDIVFWAKLKALCSLFSVSASSSVTGKSSSNDLLFHYYEFVSS